LTLIQIKILLKNKILICEPENFSNKAIDRLKEWGDVVCLTSLSELDNHLFDTNVLVIRLGVNWTSQLLSRFPFLKYILTPTTGLDHIDIDYALGKGIQVISLKGEQAFLDNITSTAEHSMALTD
jgi:D-3-phosphoglycerate dehydrogenase